MSAEARIDVSRDCAAALAGLPGVYVFSPQSPADEACPRPVVAAAGSEQEARRAAQEALAERYVGDWRFELVLLGPEAFRDVRPCAWCRKHRGYAH